MPNLIKLDLTGNMITNLKPFAKEPEEGDETIFWKNLQILDMSSNKINEITKMNCNNLRILDLCSNEIKKVEGFEGLPKLVELSLNNNQILDHTGLNNMPELKRLYLQGNRIKNLQIFENFTKLEILDLKSNNLFVFEETLPDFESLVTLNLRANKIEKIEEIEKFSSFSKLENLDISFNPFIEKTADKYIFYIITKIPNLKVINDKEITLDIRRQTQDYNRQLWNEEQIRLAEEKRKEEELENN